MFCLSFSFHREEVCIFEQLKLQLLELLLNYFPQLSSDQIEQFRQLQVLYGQWNSKINVISRKDIDALYERHVLHSLGIAKVISFKAGTKILDVGTGGGFPGIPLAILFPKAKFFLIDAIGKKIKVVASVSKSIGLSNVTALHQRAQTFKDPVDFVISRAVTKMDDFVPWVKKNIKNKGIHQLNNGILYLKGGDLTDELLAFPKAKQFPLSSYFKEDFFATKKVVHLSLQNV